MTRVLLRGSFLYVLVACLCPCEAAATEYVFLHLYQRVQLSDTIVLATITDGERASARVDETLKGSTDRSIRLVDYVDGFAVHEQQRPLLDGTQELMFLNAKGDSYAPLQTQYGRWPARAGRLESPELPGGLPLADYRRTIRELIRLQAAAARGGEDSLRAFVDALRATDPHVRLWAAHRGYQEVPQPPRVLADAYLTLWASGDPELRASMANAVVKWKLRQAAPMLAATIRDRTAPSRAVAARALGATGDRSFLTLLRATATTDEDELVRAMAFEGLKALLGQ